MAVSVLISLTLLAITRTGGSGAEVFRKSFSDQNVWLIFTAFLFARAVIGTGLGMTGGLSVHPPLRPALR